MAEKKGPGRPKKMTRVFVYGTLREGHRNWARFMNTAKRIDYPNGPVEVRGFMVDLGGFPGAKFDPEANGKVIGEIYDVDKETLEKLDTLEGYDPAHPTMSLYRRIPVKIEGEHNYGEVLAYEFNGRTENRRVIEHGDYNHRERN